MTEKKPPRRFLRLRLAIVCLALPSFMAILFAIQDVGNTGIPNSVFEVIAVIGLVLGFAVLGIWGAEYKTSKQKR
jgi:hypothetical protein